MVEQLALQGLRRLVVARVVVRGEHGRVVQVRRGRGGRARHARHGSHGVVGGVRLERVALLRHDVHGGQSLGPLQQRLVEAGEDVALQLRGGAQSHSSVWEGASQFSSRHKLLSFLKKNQTSSF